MADNQYMQPFFDTLSQGVQVAQQLRQAAQQHQEFMQQQVLAEQRQRLAEQEFQQQQQGDLANRLAQGYSPVDSSGNVASAGPAPVSAPSTPFQIGGDNNTPWQSPLAPGSSAPTFTPEVQGGDSLSDKLQNAALPSAPTMADPNLSLQLDGRTLQAPSWSEQLQRTAQAKEAATDATRVPITKEGADLIGNMFPAGTLVDPAHMPGLAAIARAKATGDRPDKVTKKEKAGFTADGKPITFDPETGEYVVGKPIPGAAAPAAGADAGAKALTENGRMTAGNKAMDEYHKYESEEAAMRQQLDRIDFAIKSNGAYNVKIDDKGVATLQKQKPDDEGKLDTSIVDDLKNQRAAIAKRTEQAMSNKIDAGQRYWDLMGIKAQWGANSGGAAPSPAQQQAAAPAPKTGGKKLTDPNIAKQYIAKAGGDKAKARQLAQQDGWSF